jgi:MmyB-like transcription regulator ligand binding domain
VRSPRRGCAGSGQLHVSSTGETLLQNRLAIALLGDHARYAGLARSVIYRWFTDPAERAIYPTADHDRQSVGTRRGCAPPTAWAGRVRAPDCWSGNC